MWQEKRLKGESMGTPYSSLKIFHHTDALEALKNKRRNAPIYIRLKPTNLCNHHCEYCTYGSGDTFQKTQNRDDVNHQDMIPWDKLQEILGDMGSMGVRAITFSGGGEPLTYPHIVEAAQMAQKSGMDLSLITNGQLLSGDKAKAFYSSKWVRISFDSPIEEKYMALRRVSAASFRQVVDNIKKFAVNKDKSCTLGINFVISKANYQQVYEAAKLLKSLGVDNVKFAAMDGNVSHYHDEIKDEVIEQIQRAKEDFADNNFLIFNNYQNDWKQKNPSAQTFPVCYTCKLVTVIAADQKVYFCHTRAYDSGAVVGDLHNKSFKELWYSEETTQRMNKLNPMMDCKNFCVYEERNRLIQAYLDADTEHVNFI